MQSANYSYSMQIRPATIGDTDEILALIYELAVYEKAPEEAKATREQIIESFFSPNPQVFCEIVISLKFEMKPVGGVPLKLIWHLKIVDN